MKYVFSTDTDVNRCMGLYYCRHCSKLETNVQNIMVVCTVLLIIVSTYS
jgi:hypothetical protein